MMGCRQKWNWSWNYLKLPLMESFQAFLCPIKLISALLWSVKVASSWIHIWTLTFRYQNIIGAKPTWLFSNQLCFDKFFIFHPAMLNFPVFKFCKPGAVQSGLFQSVPASTKICSSQKAGGSAAAEVSLSELRQIRPHSSGAQLSDALEIFNKQLFVIQFSIFQTSNQTGSSFIGLQLSDVLEFTI